MNEQLKKYYNNLKLIEATKESVRLAREAFEKTFEKELTEIKAFEEENAELKKVIQEGAIKEFDETGIKKLNGGIGIRITTKLQYREDVALGWAAENMPIIVKRIIDKKSFETFAKENELEFVDKIENKVVTFPKELGELE